MNVIKRITDILRKELDGKYSNVDQLIEKINNEITLSDALLMCDSEANTHVMSINDFIWIECRKGKHYFHTLDNVYTLCDGNIQLSSIISKDFIEVRRNVLANLSKVVKYHSYHLVLYFSDQKEHSKNIFCTALNMNKYIKMYSA